MLVYQSFSEGKWQNAFLMICAEDVVLEILI